jgi:acyl-CoA synthetase (AMP-forming)/AMP-acid ligase II
LQLRIRDGGIEVRGPNLFTTYVGEGSERTPFLPGGWFPTGDNGRLDSKGHLHILGRADGMLISGGENVHPEEIEAVLEGHAGIAGACVFGHEDRQWGQVVVAVLEAVETPLADSELTTYCRQRLAPFKRPKVWRWLEALPRTESGKKRRSRMAELIRPSLRS